MVVISEKKLQVQDLYLDFQMKKGFLDSHYQRVWDVKNSFRLILVRRTRWAKLFFAIKNLVTYPHKSFWVPLFSLKAFLLHNASTTRQNHTNEVLFPIPLSSKLSKSILVSLIIRITGLGLSGSDLIRNNYSKIIEQLKKLKYPLGPGVLIRVVICHSGLPRKSKNIKFRQFDQIFWICIKIVSALSRLCIKKKQFFESFQ